MTRGTATTTTRSRTTAPSPARRAGSSSGQPGARVSPSACASRQQLQRRLVEGRGRARWTCLPTAMGLGKWLELLVVVAERRQEAVAVEHLVVMVEHLVAGAEHLVEHLVGHLVAVVGRRAVAVETRAVAAMVAGPLVEDTRVHCR